MKVAELANVNFGYNSLRELARGASNTLVMVKDLIFASGQMSIPVLEITTGFAVIAFNTSTHYITISKGGVLLENKIGNDHANISGITYENGKLYVNAKDPVTLGLSMYAPCGKVLI